MTETRNLAAVALCVYEVTMNEPVYMKRLNEMGQDVYRRQKKAEFDTLALMFCKPGQRIRVRP